MQSVRKNVVRPTLALIGRKPLVVSTRNFQHKKVMKWNLVGIPIPVSGTERDSSAKG